MLSILIESQIFPRKVTITTFSRTELHFPNEKHFVFSWIIFIYFCHIIIWFACTYYYNAYTQNKVYRTRNIHTVCYLKKILLLEPSLHKIYKVCLRVKHYQLVQFIIPLSSKIIMDQKQYCTKKARNIFLVILEHILHVIHETFWNKTWLVLIV